MNWLGYVLLVGLLLFGLVLVHTAVARRRTFDPSAATVVSAVWSAATYIEQGYFVDRFLANAARFHLLTVARALGMSEQDIVEVIIDTRGAETISPDVALYAARHLGERLHELHPNDELAEAAEQLDDCLSGLAKKRFHRRVA